ncbi:hypothetical protein DFH28DRAFT_1135297 [Melampsora americana]|nr:hypothetical protein DFH28DRAFT_1135297 [Melampsora americana]
MSCQKDYLFSNSYNHLTGLQAHTAYKLWTSINNTNFKTDEWPPQGGRPGQQLLPLQDGKIFKSKELG